MCLIGEHLGVECKLDLQSKEDFTEEEWKLLKLRSGRSIIRKVCYSHSLSFLKLFENRQTICCNPLPNRHIQGSAKGVMSVSISLYRKAKGTIKLVPGKKLCKSCYKDVVALVGGEEEQVSSAEPTPEPTPENSQEVSVGAEEIAKAGPSNYFASPEVKSRLREKPVLMSPHTSTSTSSQEGHPSASSSPGFIPPDDRLMALNTVLPQLGVTAVDSALLRTRTTYGTRKLAEILEVTWRFLQSMAGDNTVEVPFKDDIENMSDLIDLLKEKFRSSDRSDRMRIVSLFCPLWSLVKLQEVFGPLGATEHFIKTTRAMVQKHGVLVTPKTKQGRPISDLTVEKVHQFYELNEISSKQMPGRKDYVSVYENGERIYKQKKLLLSNLDSLYEEYVQRNGETNPLSFSKFAKLRPKHCVYAGSAGTHAVCVCIYHENVNLMFEAAKFKEISAQDEEPLLSFKDCINKLICKDPTPECYLKQCLNCPSTIPLENRLISLLDDNLLETVTYRVWMKESKKYHLEKVIKPSQEFIDIFMELLEKLVTHHFVTKKQSAYYQHLIENIQEGEALVICDFAENYTCVMQNEVQGYHWTDEQITLHPFVGYYYNAARELKHVCYVCVTDHRKHVTASFHAFQKKFVQFLKKKMAEDNVTCNKIFYFSDGSSAQYKNTSNVKNICMHNIDFEGIAAEWHYFASCHGKGPCDGCGGTCKRCATRASLQGELIRNASDFHEWASKPGRFPNITIDLVTVEEVQASIQAQAERLNKVITVTGIASYHAVIPQSESSVLLKRHSDSSNSVLHNLCKLRYFVPWHKIGAFILAVINDKWCLANVISRADDKKELSVVFLTPPGRAKTYRMPNPIVQHTIPWSRVLTCTEPGHKKVYTVPAPDKNAADKELKLYLELNGNGQPPQAGEQEDGDVDDPDSDTDNCH